MDVDEFEPWRKRFAEAFDARPDIDITKFSLEIRKNKDYISRLIRRGTANPAPNLFIEICEKLGVSPGYIISGETATESREAIVRRILEASPNELQRITQLLDLLQPD